MSEYISKSALIKAIEDEQQITVSNQCNFKDIVNYSVPTVDAVPVVRCGKCKYHFDCEIEDIHVDHNSGKFDLDFHCGEGIERTAPNE